MQRLFKQIAGRAGPGEKEPQLIGRAQRKMNAQLFGPRQLSARRARSYWYSETEDVPSHHMDRVRDLAFVQPIEEAIDAIEHAELWIEEVAADGCLGLAERVLEGLHRRLAARARGVSPLAIRHSGAAPVRFGRRASDLLENHNSDPAAGARRLTSSREAV